MSNGAVAGGAGGAAAAAAAIAQATKASGVIVRVKPESFTAILQRSEHPLVVQAEGGFFNRNYQYLTSYKGLAFFTKSSEALQFSSKTEIVIADKIWIPN